MSEIEEKQHLLDSADNTGVLLKPTWKHGLILPSVFFALFGSSIFSYIVNEWTQHVIKTNLFPNESLAQSVSCGVENKSDPVYVNYKHVQQQSADWSMSYTVAENIPALFLQLILPSYSDAYGRKFLLILTTLSLVLKATIVSLVVYFAASFWYIVAANILEGLMGGPFALFSATFSFVADITSSGKKRSTVIVFVETSLMLASVLGSYLCGYFIENANLGFFYTSLMASISCTVGFVIIVLLPESLPKWKRTRPKSVTTTVRRISDFYVSKDFQGKRLSYILLLLGFFFTTLGGMNRSTMETIYFLGQPFCWDPSKISIFMLARHGAQSIVGVGLVPLLLKCISNEIISIISAASSTISFIIEAFAQTSLMIYMVPVTGMFSVLVIPMIRSIMSSMTSQDKQGAIFASIATIEVLSAIFASLTENETYSYTMSFMHGFVFIIMAIFSAVSMVMLIAYRCTRPSILITQLHVQSENKQKGQTT